MRIRSRRGAFYAAAMTAVVGMLLAAAVAAASPQATAGLAPHATPAPVVPSADPFYTYAGTRRLVSYARGAVLATRETTVSVGAIGFNATQVLYRTTDQLGQATATVATIIHPTLPSSTVKLLSYQTAYDGLASDCRPSYQLRGGKPTGGGTTIDNEYGFMLAYLTQGYTLVTTDYEGPSDDYTVGREEGDNTLDGILAAEHVLDLTPQSTPVGLVGYSGGAIATMWAAERQPTYAPQLDLIGVAAGGIAVDYAHNLAYINGSQSWGGAVAPLMLGLMRGDHLNPSTYLNARGVQILNQTAQGCLGSIDVKGLTIQEILKPQDQDWEKVPALARMIDQSILGQESTPRAPMLMAVGDADGTGDGVMVEQDVQQLAYEYCQRGGNVQLDVYPGLNHDLASVVFEPSALLFLDARYAGQAARNGCGSIKPGDPLTPLPIL